MRPITFEYPLNRSRYGAVLIFVMCVSAEIFMWKDMVVHPIGISFLIIAGLGILISVNEYWLFYSKGPEKIHIDGKFLVGAFANKRIEKILLVNITAFVDSNSLRIINPFTIKIISDVENKQIFITPHLTNLSSLIATIKQTSPNCKFILH